MRAIPEEILIFLLVNCFKKNLVFLHLKVNIQFYFLTPFLLSISSFLFWMVSVINFFSYIYILNIVTFVSLKISRLKSCKISLCTRQTKITRCSFSVKYNCRGSQAWSTAQGSGPCPAEVQGFKSLPLHYFINFIR